MDSRVAGKRMPVACPEPGRAISAALFCGARNFFVGEAGGVIALRFRDGAYHG